MIIIGERINTSRNGIAPFVEGRDAKAIVDIARSQWEAGAAFIDVNCGTLLDDEPAGLEWMVKTIQAEMNCLLSLDSPSSAALEKALAVHQGKPLINSISMEKDRLESVLPLIKGRPCSVIALAMDDSGIPETAEERFDIAARLIDTLTGSGLALGDIFIDPLVRPISTGEQNGRIVLDTIRRIHQEYPGIHTVMGLSNISFGLPGRRLLNRAFLLLAMEAGLDAAILDPIDRQMTSLLKAAEALLGRDEYCKQYITAFRSGKLEVE